MGPGDFYTMFQLGESCAGAACAPRDEEKAPPFDVMTFGRMAVIGDPTGAAFCIWEPKDHMVRA